MPNKVIFCSTLIAGFLIYGLNYGGLMGNVKSAVFWQKCQNSTQVSSCLESMEDLDTIQCLTFSSLISAVDPVAVLAIFQEIGVNVSLYFLVFGKKEMSL